VQNRSVMLWYNWRLNFWVMQLIELKIAQVFAQTNLTLKASWEKKICESFKTIYKTRYPE
jgi:hypothetical protein